MPPSGEKRRWTASSPCPICGGWDRLARGRGERCAGYLSSDGKFAYCTREEHSHGAAGYSEKAAAWFHAVGPREETVPRGKRKAGEEPGTYECHYDYQDEHGDLLFQVVRYRKPDGDKDFRQRTPDPKAPGGWRKNVKGTRMVPFRLPSILEADPEEFVWFTEGEKDALNLVGLGLVATTNPGGSSAWGKLERPELELAFGGRSVVIVLDHDEPSRKWARKMAEAIYPVAREVRVLDLFTGSAAGWAEHSDVTDWIAREGKGSKEEIARRLAELAYERPLWDPAARIEGPDQAGEDEDLIDVPEWPAPPRAEAFRGLLGELVDAIAPHTESDRVAILAQILVGFGNLIGRSAHFRVEADHHYCNLFTCLVGPSAKARKGSSWGISRWLLRSIDPLWADHRIQSGLNSGQGLVHAVRDPIYKREPVREQGRVVRYEEVMADGGVDDKRLLCVEPEFTSVLRAFDQEANLLSEILRQAWDGIPLGTMTKTNQTRATGAHVSIIGHATIHDLRMKLNASSATNGFANRFLWLCVRRAGLLPLGGRIFEVDFTRILGELTHAAGLARDLGAVGLERGAEELWCAEYPRLSEGRPGFLGSVTARAEAQVRRLAVLYAAIGGRQQVFREDLEAGLALWDYSERSAAFLFGESLGDPDQDKILSALKAAGPDGLSRSQIRRDCFSDHLPAKELATKLSHMLAAGVVRRESVSTGGRPSERWRINQVIG